MKLRILTPARTLLGLTLVAALLTTLFAPFTTSRAHIRASTQALPPARLTSRDIQFTGTVPRLNTASPSPDVTITRQPAAPTAPAVALSIVEVGAPDINCIFDTDCTITVNDTTDHFMLDGTSGDAFLQSRTFPRGEAGTPAEGLYGYLYRIDLRELVGILDIPCITSFSIDFGPVVSLDYDGDEALDGVFVITRGGLGSVVPSAADKAGDTITFSFAPGVCAGPSAGEGESTYFFGLTSWNPAQNVRATVRDNREVAYTLEARAPAIPMLTANPNNGPRGTVTQLQGTNFPPNTIVQLLWSSELGQLLGSGPVNTDGEFVIPVIVDPDASIGDMGPIVACIECFDGSRLAEAAFTLTNAAYEPALPADFGPRAVRVDFDALPVGAVVTDQYADLGVHFVDTEQLGVRPIVVAEPSTTSRPNALFNDTQGGANSRVPLTFRFDQGQARVGLYLGNGEDLQPDAVLSAYDKDNNLIGQVSRTAPEPVSAFLGIASEPTGIFSVTLDYRGSSLGEEIDDLIFEALPQDMAPDVLIIPWKAIIDPVIIGPIIFSPDFSIDNIEVTQGIQCLDVSQGDTTCPDNSLDLVINRTTVVRVYVDLSSILFSEINNVPVRLHVQVAGAPEVTMDGLGKAVANPQRGEATHSVNFYLNIDRPNDTVPAVQFWAEVDPDNAWTETNESNNRFPSGTGTVSVDFFHRRSVEIASQPIDYRPSGGGANIPTGAPITTADVFLQSIWPIPDQSEPIEYRQVSPLLWEQSIAGDGVHDLIRYMNGLWVLANLFAAIFGADLPVSDHYYGWLPAANYNGGHADMPVYDHAGGLGVVSVGGDSTSQPGGRSPMRGTAIFAHELTHNHDVKHTNTADGCGSADGSTDFPYASSSIQEFGFDVFTGQVWDPADTHDIMSYCVPGTRNGWISPFTWTKMFPELAPTAAKRQVLSLNSPSIQEELIHITGVITDTSVVTDAKRGLLLPALRLAGDTSYTPSTPGSFSVAMEDINGTVLISRTFAMEFVHEGTPPEFEGVDPEMGFFSFVLPWQISTDHITLRENGEEIDRITVSPSSPVVTVTSPSMASVWTGVHTITWQASDADGDPLSFSVFYSNDGGLSWDPLANGLSDTSLEVDSGTLPGGAGARIRVLASDGINTGQDTSPAFSVTEKSPQVTIQQPSDHQVFATDAPLLMIGSAQDLEDGVLNGLALTWTSDRDGVLGSGEVLIHPSLSRGWHDITLTALDSDGQSSSATVRVLFGEKVFLPMVIK